MESETPSLVEDEDLVASVAVAVGAGTSNDNRGKHRILAELKRLEQELRSLEEELGELERTENVSMICSELLPYIENKPDPLLPTTNGPINVLWERWFEGPQEAQSCRCRIL
ncbi:hypothetical protein FNV43_RR23327 [Rhamnella rubrinervis]|uniref:G protein gamma domain-containing protein n=1 Tax=Rhamnella rubrinervis TaxID=2594499 RepID=A0A8K0DS36_9ROSA|nr:hypothetical protein FNV43_RR23327 [Rhamnella rubrinervis]